MRVIEAEFSLPDGRIITYRGEMHHGTIGSPDDTHKFSGDFSGLRSPPGLSGRTAGPDFVMGMLRGYASLIGATVEITHDNGELEWFPDMPGVDF
jgi:hypothetical protein